jgi:hypothetical protein
MDGLMSCSGYSTTLFKLHSIERYDECEWWIREDLRNVFQSSLYYFRDCLDGMRKTTTTSGSLPGFLDHN